ncbi:MAG: mechanosensitive ion channel [Bacteroidales bacterium]|nr:mechanosensitive ion channel [Bacteroidales bacterium]MBN2748715.1 mechanosensitive ion channel [Bacteroidales bacterium]
MNDILDYKILEYGNYSLAFQHLLNLTIFIAIVIVLLAIIKRVIYRSKALDPAKKFSVNKLSQYTIATLSIVISLHLLGLNISVLLAGSAAILVGLGFGLQHLFNDFISGVILLLDATLKVGDIVEVNGMIYKVEEINFRTTTVIGRDENYVILPNSELTSNRVVNWTYNGISSRFRITLGVDYETDIDKLITLLEQIPLKHPKVLHNPKPFVRFEDYAESSLKFAVFFYSDEIFRVERIKSDIRIEIFRTLKKQGINIPFPQRVVRIKSESNAPNHNQENQL